jgi:DNA-binding response OmpR family regulator
MARLLLMEDDVALGFRTASDLRLAGHEVIVAYSATDAKAELLREPYDVIITDIIVRIDGRAVPDGGIALIAWVRRTPDVRKLPIIAVSGTLRLPGMKHILHTARTIGADVGMEKPFDLCELLDEIARLVAPGHDGLASATLT